jgi:hypothetical protein
MVRARGYPGSVTQLRRMVHTLRPATTATVYRRLTTLMAEDYGECRVMLSRRDKTRNSGGSRLLAPQRCA